jgi:hypothetical protein
MAAGLYGDVQGRVTRFGFGLLEGKDLSMRSTGLLVIARPHDVPLAHKNCPDQGIGTGGSSPSGCKPESVFHKFDVLIDVIHRRALVFRGCALAFGLAFWDVVAATRRARVLVFTEVLIEAFTAFFFGFDFNFATGF